MTASTPQTVHFFSDGLKLEADWLLPEGASADAPVPGIVMCPGFGAQRSLGMQDYAERFRDAGFAALWLDYRGFGGSEGERERIIAGEQVRDIRAALTWLGMQAGVDAARLGVWGTSGGAANTVQVAAIDPRVRCAVAQVGHGDGYGMIAGCKTPEEMAELEALLQADREQRVRTGKSGRMRVIDFVSDPATRAYVLGVAETDPSVIAYLTLESAEAAMEFRPVDLVHRIAPRAMMLICAERDEICPPAAWRALYEKLGEPKRWTSYPIGHYDIYTPEWVERSAADAVAWFREHL